MTKFNDLKMIKLTANKSPRYLGGFLIFMGLFGLLPLFVTLQERWNSSRRGPETHAYLCRHDYFFISHGPILFSYESGNCSR